MGLPTTYYLLPTTYYLLPTTYCLLPTAYCLLRTAYCILPTAYCLLPTAYCLLLPTTAYCLLPTAYTTYCLLPILSTVYCLQSTTACMPTCMMLALCCLIMCRWKGRARSVNLLRANSRRCRPALHMRALLTVLSMEDILLK